MLRHYTGRKGAGVYRHLPLWSPITIEGLVKKHETGIPSNFSFIGGPFAPFEVRRMGMEGVIILTAWNFADVCNL